MPPPVDSGRHERDGVGRTRVHGTMLLLNMRKRKEAGHFHPYDQEPSRITRLIYSRVSAQRTGMVRGKLEVLLVGAKGLENTDFLCKMDPYAVLTCRTQEQKSSVASGKGSDPEWNESFVFTVSDSVPELTVKLMDNDTGSSDDFVGEATIPLEAVFFEGNIPPTVYNVVKDQRYCGEIKIGLSFIAEETRGSDFLAQRYGGWNESS
ncbi:unnamed protein product [Musa acuminata var. zebrina]